jgi:hypothetical protein
MNIATNTGAIPPTLCIFVREPSCRCAHHVICFALLLVCCAHHSRATLSAVAAMMTVIVIVLQTHSMSRLAGWQIESGCPSLEPCITSDAA